jgi:hypothetical protein
LLKSEICHFGQFRKKFRKKCHVMRMKIPLKSSWRFTEQKLFLRHAVAYRNFQPGCVKLTNYILSYKILNYFRIKTQKSAKNEKFRQIFRAFWLFCASIHKIDLRHFCNIIQAEKTAIHEGVWNSALTYSWWYIFTQISLRSRREIITLLQIWKFRN